MEINDSTLHILMVTHVQPFPPSAGNEIRIFKMLKCFKENGFRVSLILKTLENEEISNECITGLNAIIDDLYIFDSRCLNSNESSEKILSDEAENNSRLVGMQDGFCPQWFANQVRQLIKKISPSAVIAQYVFMSRILLNQGHNFLKIIDTHDLFSKKQDAIKRYGIEDFGLLLSSQEEALLLRRADVILAIQSLEFQELQYMVPDRKVLLTGFDVDVPILDLANECFGSVLIVASDNEFNVRGTQEFVDFIWPLVLEQCPQARLRIVGKVSHFVDTVDLSIEKIGFIRDLSAEYAKACVVVNPCGVGTGLKIKTVEALAWGKAHIGWPASADGLPEFTSLPYLIAQNIVEFADSVVKLLKDSQERRRLGFAAQKYAERHFGRQTTYESLISLLKAQLVTSKKLLN